LVSLDQSFPSVNLRRRLVQCLQITCIAHNQATTSSIPEGQKRSVSQLRTRPTDCQGSASRSCVLLSLHDQGIPALSVSG
jgi:hypothetical protein